MRIYIQPESVQITYDVIHSLSAAVNKNKSASSQVKTIITSPASSVDPVRSTPDITSNGSGQGLWSSSSNSSLLEPIPSSKVDPKKKSKAPRKHSAPVQPKSGALAAAMMAATVAGGSGFLDARKGIQQEDSRHNILRSKKSKVNLDDGDVPLPNSTVSSVNSSTVNIPSKLADIVTLEASSTPKIVDRKFVPLL